MQKGINALNKGEPIGVVAANGLTRKNTEAAVNAVFDAIGNAIAERKPVQLAGLEFSL